MLDFDAYCEWYVVKCITQHTLWYVKDINAFFCDLYVFVMLYIALTNVKLKTQLMHQLYIWFMGVMHIWCDWYVQKGMMHTAYLVIGMLCRVGKSLPAVPGTFRIPFRRLRRVLQ